MKARPTVILMMLFSLVFNQAVGTVLHVHGPVDPPIDQTQKYTAHSHHGSPSGAAEHCDLESDADAVCCCAMALSGCGTSALTASNLILAINQSDTWSLSDSVHLHDYFPDIELRPPRV